MLCTVDGLKAFHARRLGLRLVPDWPAKLRPGMLDQPFPGGERPSGRPVAATDGFRFDYASLLACAWGRPSDAFGEMYRSHRIRVFSGITDLVGQSLSSTTVPSVFTTAN